MWTVDKIKSEISDDDKIKVAGFDVDGILRGMYKPNLSQLGEYRADITLLSARQDNIPKEVPFHPRRRLRLLFSCFWLGYA